MNGYGDSNNDPVHSGKLTKWLTNISNKINMNVRDMNEGNKKQ